MTDAREFPLLVSGCAFKAYYQRGNWREETSEWQPNDDGLLHLVACECGRCAYAVTLDDAVNALQRSYIFQGDAHRHSQSTHPCNIIEAMQAGADGWVMGKIVMPDLLMGKPAR
jgi:hypothetical protein